MGLHHSWKEILGTARSHRAVLMGRFKCNGANDPSEVSGDLATFFDVTRDSQGTILLTWKDGNFPGKIEFAEATFLGDVTHGDEVAVEAAPDAGAAITIKTYDAASDTDIPDGENIYVQVLLWVRCLVSDRV